MARRPQTFGKVEKMNHTLKKNVAKLCEETHLHWDQVLPITLLRHKGGSSKWDSVEFL